MSKNASILVIVLLLVGAAAIAIVKSRDPGGENPGSGETGNSAKVVKPGSGGSTGGATGMGAKAIDRSAREIRNEELVEKYGSARTNLSRQVSENVVSLLDDAVAMGEMMSRGGAAFGGGQMMMRGMQRRAGIELTEEQQGRAMEIYKAHQEREMEKFKGTVETLRKDPSVLMELFLAGDAKARDEMTPEEYAEVQAEAGERLGEVINPLDEKNFRPGNPMDDEAFRSEFEAILDDEQAAMLNAKIAEQEAARVAAAGEEPSAPATDTDVPDSSIANMQTMELEQLDKAVGSAKQMTSGLKQMMEGFGGLRKMREESGEE
jgi:polyhydroxyalkanoate synthesis regulator phasin